MNTPECAWCGDPAVEVGLILQTPLCGSRRCRRLESEEIESSLRHEDEERERIVYRDAEVIRPEVLN